MKKLNLLGSVVVEVISALLNFFVDRYRKDKE